MSFAYVCLFGAVFLPGPLLGSLSLRLADWYALAGVCVCVCVCVIVVVVFVFVVFHYPLLVTW
jgi:hypothetical protein